MAKVYISVGSNIEPEKHFRLGLQALSNHFKALNLSSVYLSEAVGFDGGDFLNMVVGAETERTINEVVDILKAIEFENGRAKDAKKFSSRTLDLDLLLYDDKICQLPVRLPRSEITFNAFVLWPLAEIAPNLVHPELSKTYSVLWQEYDKSSQLLKPIAFDFLGF
ncbi:2-amino-4-hydroxy-6-hydroxymethyldihydropteridine diphosphokinase [Parashewanella curva]|uniref:2-amino-4-hydroxy-6-hydroxymethyldihydropteridine diphosphokinase n=1 Tax=Parashewanella curva TaxID=2338552 RepID=A0A3L8Q3K8_9GAMM|nr:2-amino-4-hydroxy-6-hydroxymethyldihydropteridine diphosphokinase [Parashewanella curva]RLV61743.1 2-amino-4-hydroxy-6-hydroxymethyldihydropteridine diphosphokinase [Parashewanella curva]